MGRAATEWEQRAGGLEFSGQPTTPWLSVSHLFAAKCAPRRVPPPPLSTALPIHPSNLSSTQPHHQQHHQQQTTETKHQTKQIQHNITYQAAVVVPETLEPSLQLAAAVLSELKMPQEEVAATVDRFRKKVRLL